MTKPIYAEVTTYKSHIVVEYKEEKSNDVLTTPFDRNSMGYVVSDVGYVGISEEAYTLLSLVKKGTDSIGNIDVFKADNGKHVFCTLGGKYFLVPLREAEGSSNFTVPPIEEFQLIENNVPEGAIDYIDEKED